MPDRKPEFDPVRVFCAVMLGGLLLFVLLLLIFGCAAAPYRDPVPEPELTWEFLDRPGLPRKACLPEEDVAKLRDYENKCSYRD